MPNTARLFVDKAQAIVFDLDGTLVDTFDDLALALDDALREFGLPPAPRDILRADIHRGLDETARALLLRYGTPTDIHEDVIAAYRKHYRRRAHAASRPYPGVKEFLDQLRQRDCPMAICTNKLTADAKELLALLGIDGFFSEVIGIDAGGLAKPAPEPLWLTIRRLDSTPDVTLFIGDSEIDAQCAINAGVSFLLHDAGFAPEAAAAIGCAGRFRAYADLYDRQQATVVTLATDR